MDKLPQTSEVWRALQGIRSGALPAELESSTLEFKADAGDSRKAERDVAEAAICLANAAGGWVVLGVADRVAGPGAFTGTSLAADEVQRRVYALTEPPLLVDVYDYHEDGAHLVVVRIPRGVVVHADKQGRATRRVARECLPLGPEAVRRLGNERIGYDPSAEPSGANQGDLAPAALATARQMLAALPDDRARDAKLGDAALVRKLGLLHEDGMLNRAGEYLLCAVRDSRVQYLYRRSSGGEPQVVMHFDGPVVLVLAALLEQVRTRSTSTALLLKNGQRLELSDYPTAAVRELVVNALIHRDLAQARPIVVDQSPEALTITSPGPLVNGVTTANILTTTSRPRNPRLASAVRRLGLAEEIGRGIDRAYREMLRVGRAAPTIEEEADQVRVTIPGGEPSARIAELVARLPPELAEDTDTLIVLWALRTRPTVTAALLAPMVQRDEAATSRVLERLARGEGGLLETTRASAASPRPVYRLRPAVVLLLGPALAYRRRTMEEVDRKVIAHVNEYGDITNRTVQNLLEVDLQRARAILGELVKRGVLVKTSAHERGPGVTYGPGTQFPVRRGATRPLPLARRGRGRTPRPRR